MDQAQFGNKLLIERYKDGSYTVSSEDQSKALRKNYAGINFTYNEEKDAFIAPQPYPSWILNESTCLWKAPIDMPDDGNSYIWNEENQNWEAQ
jgi:hypothetical protein